MKRWKATCEGKPVLVYAKDEKSARQGWIDRDCIISEYDDLKHIKLIEQIKGAAEFVGSSARGNEQRELYKIPFWGGHILIKLSKDLDDGHYYDLCRYQKIDSQMMIPITWDLCDVQSFCTKFGIINSVVSKEQGYVVTFEDIRRMKARRFYSKNGIVYWRDSDGYFYFASKCDLPRRENISEWSIFHDRPDAVLVDCRWGLFHTRERRWWLNMEDFLRWYRDTAVPGTPSFSSAPEYNVIKTGYRKLSPEKRKVIFRLPYYPVDNENKSPERVAAVWNRQVNDNWFGNNSAIPERIITDMIKQWREYKENTGRSSILGGVR